MRGDYDAHLRPTCNFLTHCTGGRSIRSAPSGCEEVRNFDDPKTQHEVNGRIGPAKTEGKNLGSAVIRQLIDEFFRGIRSIFDLLIEKREMLLNGKMN